jgi:Mrp family chromosome partitioning ATPase
VHEPTCTAEIQTGNLPVLEFCGSEVDFSVESLMAAGLAPPAERRRRLLHEYRIVRRSLLESLTANAPTAGDSADLVMVASAFPGEGKTFTSVNLAQCLVLEQAREVVLIDADLSRRDLSIRLGLGDESGLIDLLKYPDLRAGSAVHRTTTPGLCFLPAGQPDELANELLGSEAMKATVRQLAAGGRLLIFDSAPLLMTSEAATLSDLVGQVVLVVRAGNTPRHAVSAAIRQLSENKPVAMLLNAYEASTAKHGDYGYYGGYGTYG